MTVDLLGIRHHGPGSARSVLAALDELQPDAVLVELPADCQAALGWFGDAGLRPPVALLGWVLDEPRRAAFLPFAEFSPEWGACRWATEDGRVSLKVPSGSLSTAEAISVVTSGLALAAHFGDGALGAGDVAAGILGAVVKDPVHDDVAWREYLEGVVRDRPGWEEFYEACRDLG